MNYEGYRIERHPKNMMFEIKPESAQGTVPKELRGYFTSPREAQVAVHFFKESSKGKRNATAKAKGRSQ